MNQKTRFQAARGFVRPLSVVAICVAGLSGCVSVPTGPSAMALPGAGKTWEQFRADDANCQQFAQQRIGGAGAQQASDDAAVRSAALGTVVGAVAGAAIGGSHGAAVGAGTGLLFGTAAGADAGNASAYGAQRRYDMAYTQCMYSLGERVPVSGRMQARQYAPAYSDNSIPPPPPGSPPPPPPAYYAPPPPR